MLSSMRSCSASRQALALRLQRRGGGDDRCQRRAQIVRDGGEKGALQLLPLQAGLGQQRGLGGAQAPQSLGEHAGERAACSRPSSSAAGAGSMRTAPMTWPREPSGSHPGIDARPAAGARPDHRRLVDGATQRPQHRRRQALGRVQRALRIERDQDHPREGAAQRPFARGHRLGLVGRIEQLGGEGAQLPRPTFALGGQPATRFAPGPRASSRAAPRRASSPG